jgi:hypothetical protein
MPDRPAVGLGGIIRLRTARAIESAGGLGKLLAQRMVCAGEHVVDVPPTLSARVRLLGSTRAGKNDSNDALSTAIAGLRHLRVAHGPRRGSQRGDPLVD